MEAARAFHRGSVEMQFAGDWAQLASDCLSGAGALLLWGLATIVACFLFKGVFGGLGWITERVFQRTNRAYVDEIGRRYRPN
jgi:hypothetical protein